MGCRPGLLSRGVSLKLPLRVAFFPDSFDEPNGVATLSREFAAFAECRQLPFCYAHAGKERRANSRGSVTALELNRSWASFPLDKDLYCDPLLTRHRAWVIAHLKEFRPDLIHITGPGDFGILGFWVSHSLRIPLVASWHTNLHEYASQRLQKALSLVVPFRLRGNPRGTPKSGHRWTAQNRPME